MTQDISKYPLPFLTRDMLAFEHGVTLGVRIRSQSRLAGTVAIRGVTREGMFTFKHVLISDGTVQTENFRIPDVPIFISVLDINDAFLQGQNFITLFLTLNDDPLFELCSGFVYTHKGISYPVTNSVDSASGHGEIRVVQSSDPAAGSEISFNSDTGQIWHILGGRLTLVTDANAANRRVHLVFSNPTATETWDVFSDVDQTASLTRNYTFGKFGAIPDTSDDNDILVPLPDDIWLPSVSDIITATTNKQATDNFSKLSLIIESYWSPAFA